MACITLQHYDTYLRVGIPTEIGQLDELVGLELQHNQLAGACVHKPLRDASSSKRPASHCAATLFI